MTLLVARTPKLRGALAAAKKAGHAFAVIDGTLVPSDRVAADRPFYLGKHRKHGMNLQVISSPAGEILQVSGPLPGATHDLTAARIWGIIRELEAAGLIVLADKGYIGAGEHVLTPYRGRSKPGSQQRPREAPRSRRASQRSAQNLGHPAQTPLLPVACRPDRQGDSRPPGPRDHRMKNVQCAWLREDHDRFGGRPPVSMPRLFLRTWARY